MVKDYKQKVNHSGYRNKNVYNKKWGIVYKEITKSITKVSQNQTLFEHVSDNFLVIKTASNIVVYVGGSFCLLTYASAYFFIEKFDNGTYVLLGLASLILAYLIIYFFTKPKKEHILNRLDGLITFTGWYWHPNITMKFDDVIFVYSTGGDDGSAAFLLQIARPDRLTSRENFMLGGTCYDDMSLIAWYMDKNRPLPPGTAFDPYRQKDFKRRKAEGFPSPLYESNVKTPEATKEQQDERDKYWRG